MADARLGLRACRGDLNGACLFLQRRDEEKKERSRREEEEERLARERKKLGKTASGQWVNLGYLDTIVNMGFERNRVIGALKKTNNDINQALEALQNDFESFEPASGGIDDALVAQVVLLRHSAVNLTNKSLFQVVSLGYPIEEAREALEEFNGDVELAVESLASGVGRSKRPKSDQSNSSSFSFSYPLESMLA